MEALRRFAALAERMNLSGIIAVATAAVRDAKDGAAFVDAVERETGLQIHVASARRRRARREGGASRLAGRGRRRLRHGRRLDGARPGRRRRDRRDRDLDLGPLQLAPIDDAGARQKAIRKGVKALRKACAVRCAALPRRRVLARGRAARHGADRLPAHVLHGYEPPVSQIVETAPGSPGSRSRTWRRRPASASTACRSCPTRPRCWSSSSSGSIPERVAISAYGLREGLLYRQMPEAMRRRDPLIEACRHMEKAMARCPGFGAALYEWLLPLYVGMPEAEKRLVRAACLIHDINWRGHPDFRAELCFESVTRANICGIDHPSGSSSGSR
jgi:exopolyphosphatase / guanosine-5'-triphosphate,3'-diphosphate pyrophosphatase